MSCTSNPLGSLPCPHPLPGCASSSSWSDNASLHSASSLSWVESATATTDISPSASVIEWLSSNARGFERSYFYYIQYYISIIMFRPIYTGTQWCEVVRYSNLRSNHKPVSLSAWAACLTASPGHENTLVVTFPRNFASFSGASGRLSILAWYKSVRLNTFSEWHLLK